jgi:hypothetical protein
VTKNADDGALVLNIVQNKRAKERNDRKMITRGDMRKQLCEDWKKEKVLFVSHREASSCRSEWTIGIRN